MTRLNLDDFAKQIHDWYQRLAQLQQLTGELPSTPQQQKIIVTAFEEFSTAFEELQVASEELHQQHEELLVTQQALIAERQRYQQLFEFAPDAYLVTNVKGVIQEANRAAATLLNCRQQFLVGKPLASYVVEEERHVFRQQLNQLRQVEGVQEWEMSLQLPHPTPLITAVRVGAIQTPEGQLMGLHWLMRDITERKRLEESLHRLNEELDNRVKERTSDLEKLNHQLLGEIAERLSAEVALYQREQEYRALVEHAPDIIERFDPQGRHLYVNPAIESVTGKSPNEFIGKTNREIGISEPNLSLWEEALSRVFEKGQEEQLEFSVVTPKGLKYYQTRLVPELETDGNFISVVGISREITDHKLAIEALRESEERFRQLTENINEVFWMVTPDFNQRLYVSPAYEEIWGRSCQSLYNESNSWRDAIHPEDREVLIAKMEQESRGESTEMEYRIVRLDGSIRWIRDRAFPICDAQGQVYRIAGIAEDITCRKQAELEIFKALQREKELSAVKSSFVAMTSHEFRTPLTAISSSTDLLDRYRNRLSQEKQQAHLHRIKSAVERMTQMLNDILLMSEAEAGKLQFNPTPLNLLKFCRHLVEDVQPTAKEQQVIHFTYRSDGNLAGQDIDEIEKTRFDFLSGLALWDEKLLRHILSNLLSNALKYSPEGGTVQFDLTAQDDRVIFQIQDQGIGIPPADQSRLFEAFHRANNVGTIQGTGLGLVIVKQCVDLHRGEIRFTSEVGKGTTFIVTLPLS